MKNRIEYFDTSKGILIILVVIGHIFESGVVNQYVYSFHMPAFFILSGIMMNFSSALRKPLYSALLDKIYSLIIPFLFFETIGVLSNIVRYGITLNIFGYVSNTLRLWCNNGPDWFIWALFMDEVLFLLVHQLLKNKYIIWIVSACIGVFMIINHNFYSTFGSTGVGFLFLTFGYYVAPLFMEEYNGILTAISVVVSIITCVLNGKVDLGPWVFGNVPLYIVGALSGTYFVVQISKYFSCKLLTYYGRNTLSILGTHQAINLPIRVWADISEYSVAAGIIVLVGIMIVEIPIIYLFNELIPFLVGKKEKGIILEIICAKVTK